VTKPGIKARAAAPVVQILGVCFFDGSAEAAAEKMCRTGGYVVVPAAPALVNIQYDEGYRRALVDADVAIADSGIMVLLWKHLRGGKIARISGLAYLRALLARPELRSPGATFLVLPNPGAQEKALRWLQAQGFDISEAGCYIAPHYGHSVEDKRLAAILSGRAPQHVLVAIGGGTQEKLGWYLRHNLRYRPAIHCIGAALGFLTGDQRPIPDWADRMYLGWVLRLARDPRRYLQRFWVAHELPGLIRRYGSELPPLKRKS
jgi:N-acetylglucosaminyldiphosphoundecaprenol N-acetyl-beta-D-mannosaminyltransferase